MYNENSFKNYIFWIKVKRIFFMIIFSVLGCIIGIATSQLIIDVLLFDTVFKPILIAVFTLLFFSISLLITANTGKEVQDGYWKIAVLRKLSAISKKLDSPNEAPSKNLDNINTKPNKKSFTKNEIEEEENIE